MELVKVINNEMVTSSRKVAISFGKRHAHVIDAIENHLKELHSTDFSVKWFYESSYKDGSGRTCKEYLMNRDGFSLLVMGFNNTKHVLNWKIKYINAFNLMENKLSEIYKGNIEIQQKVIERIDLVEQKLDNQMTIDHAQQRKLQKEIAIRVYVRLKENYLSDYKEDFDKEKRKLFSQLHREIKDRFAVSSYTDVRIKDFSSCLNYIKNWIERKD